MGSLMAGWDSPVSDPNSVKLRRNKSLTKERIEAFWSTKKRKEEEHLRDISLLSPRTRNILFEEAEKELSDMESASNLDKLILKNGWWISSHSAFLNEPPVIAVEGSNRKYAAQFHVANITGSPGSEGPDRDQCLIIMFAVKRRV
ncbi:hypothetical protein F511_44426 [Dorcoceras hygrometricum]|uniref:Uncharacterized protein n=1 Tax=Dorcoceras hygrometricum TaxID=472368 RepID=A0A2Z6ZXX9_9LAMI|nr:hypothetical protein F511_44426 [Dorcoceras hygrometricum]